MIVSNLGLKPWDAVAVVPERRDCPVLFLTGYVDETIRSACATKHIPYRMVPMDVSDLRRELRLALDVDV